MKLTTRILSFALVLAVAALTPTAALASGGVPTTWQATQAQYPEHQIQTFEMTLEQTRGGRVVWGDILAQQSQPVRLLVFSHGGYQINTATNNIPPATGEHIAIILQSDSRAANLYDVIVKGDVLGTGLLNISQLVRLASALNGKAPLEGPYLRAADINGGGNVDIGDLTILARWIRTV